ncbi:SubName: Full=Uncharacterized protein {ECO:0000313/EMBL:CCA72047.1} [Serendipita indica DSM 11827]|uniref:DUF6533 domain-containing protein n=1 Tax=Serendipita indica (strain DSM 11827) TaxID=1109443 RepID=G4TL49_SERID|nr:SubName: Full=Uncharacterized protein {ECO:0000313/EMBL:CCA72047.1} [Serendipita indica DSM 11827]CCA72047.1 hypothetical protein PIIN_05982 [Serendipita indica DSM 11827]
MSAQTHAQAQAAAQLASLLQQLAIAASNITKSRYTSVAGLTVVLYDILLLSADVWQKPKRNASRYAYFINRYVPPVFLLVANYQLGGFRPALSDQELHDIHILFVAIVAKTGYQRLQSLKSSRALRLLVNILVLRVLALYGSGRVFTTLLYALFAISYGVCFGITVNAVIVIRAGAMYDHRLRVCSIESTPEIFRFIFIAPVFFEVLIGALTLWKAVQHAYVLSNASSAPMLYIMFRDGIAWFIAVCGLRIWNALIWVFLPQSMVYLGIYILWALVSTFVSRFFLNILDVVNSSLIDGFSVEYATVRQKEQNAAIRHQRTFGGNTRSVFAEVSMSAMSSVPGGTAAEASDPLEGEAWTNANHSLSHSEPRRQDTFV